MIEWVKRMTASASGRVLSWLLISAITTSGLGYYLSTSWSYIRTAPLPVQVLTALGATFPFVALCILIWLYVNLPIAHGTYGSRYLLWYRFPLRRIIWDFRQFIGGNCGRGSPVVISSFQLQFKITRGKGIHPRRAYIRCDTTGFNQDVLISAENEYVRAEKIAFLPAKVEFQAHASFGEITRDRLLQMLDGFEFVFEYDEGRFERQFKREELELIIERFWRYSNGAPQPIGHMRNE